MVPTGPRTTIDGYGVCFLSELLTKGERSLIASGKAATVLEMRRSFQEAMRAPISWRRSGRKVVTFMRSNNGCRAAGCVDLVDPPRGVPFRRSRDV